jgi:hypothetical protein
VPKGKVLFSIANTMLARAESYKIQLKLKTAPYIYYEIFTLDLYWLPELIKYKIFKSQII